ncbi:nucleotide exchange factor GrpE [Methyloceanibacter caenitepidi]|uniref:Protein GrpE n=1 Tax=Methyloceanibacter caenitepidi TaxID=1384459 RepID=A0A0A8JZT8_9HYPH|nr:nucleotide exchange factor GrpE [Methyloceanibacter caenitepidi]BAQ15916.1 heat shock protein GrpE [Methyloceanibacter caenitepidi]
MPDDPSDTRPNDNPQTPQGAPETSADTDAGTDVAGDLDALLTENADMRDKLLRTMADMENLRRRTEREKEDTSRYAISNFARDVLTIGDNLRRVIEHVPAEAAEKDPALKSFLEGVELTERELLKMMEKHGVTRLEPLGQRFDPNEQQAMYEVPTTDVPEGTVVQVMQAGFTIGDRVLRPALVAVSKGGPKPAPTPKGDAQGKQGNGFGTGTAANDDNQGKR